MKPNGIAPLLSCRFRYLSYLRCLFLVDTCAHIYVIQIQCAMAEQQKRSRDFLIADRLGPCHTARHCVSEVAILSADKSCVFLYFMIELAHRDHPITNTLLTVSFLSLSDTRSWRAAFIRIANL